MDTFDDLIGGGSSLDDLLGTPKKRRGRPSKPKAAKKPKAKLYVPLIGIEPVEGGIWERRKSKGKNLGRTCLVCNEELKYRKGRPPVVCRKPKCFREYRNMYRKDYDSERAP